MAAIHLIEGPVGAGKSTFARRLAQDQRMVHLNLDEWFSTLFSPDRPSSGLMPWYVERKWRCIDRIWTLGEGLVRNGCSAVMELGLLTRADRERIYERADAARLALEVHVLDAPREIRRARVQQRNKDRGATFFMEVPDHFFDMASDMWEEPDEAERTDRSIRLVSTAS